MKRFLGPVAALALASAALTTGAGQAQQPDQVHAQGCVEAGVEARCLVVKDIESGKLYNVFIKDPKPAIGDGIEFTGVLFDGVTVCMQGIPVQVTTWARKDSLKCPSSQTPRR
jgi:hypothetical protein